MVICTFSTKLKDWHNCHRLYYLTYKAGGKGYQPVTISEDLLFGLAFHKGAELIVGGKTVTDAFDGAAYQYLSPLPDDLLTLDGYPRKHELSTILYGALRVFHDLFLPDFRKTYEFVATEIELSMPISDVIIYLTRLDALIRRTADRFLFNLNYKTSAQTETLYKDNQYNAQLLMEGECAKANYGWVGGTILLGIDKGRKVYTSKKEQEEGKFGFRRSSPFAYAYVSPNCVPGTEREYRHEWTSKWQRVAAWVEPGMKEWMDFLIMEHPDLCRAQLMQAPEIQHDPRRVESVKRQIQAIETNNDTGSWAVSHSNEPHKMLDLRFPQNFHNCNNCGGYRYPCPFVPVCHKGAKLTDPMLYKVRVPNHPMEEEFL